MIRLVLSLMDQYLSWLSSWLFFLLTVNSFLSLWSLFSWFNLMVYLKVHQQKFKSKLFAAKPIFVRYKVSYSCGIDSYLPVVTQSSHNSSLNCHVDFVLKSICGVSLPLALLMCCKHKHKLGHWNHSIAVSYTLVYQMVEYLYMNIFKIIIKIKTLD